MHCFWPERRRLRSFSAASVFGYSAKEPAGRRRSRPKLPAKPPSNLHRFFGTIDIGVRQMPSFDIEALLNSETGPAFRAEMGPWIEHLIPGESLVPEVYRPWRPLVRDAISFIFSRLSPPRLARSSARCLRATGTSIPRCGGNCSLSKTASATSNSRKSVQ